MQFDAFDSNRLHESEIRGQGNQRFFPSLSPRRFAALSLSRKKFQGKPLGPGYDFMDKATSNVAIFEYLWRSLLLPTRGDVALKDSKPSL